MGFLALLLVIMTAWLVFTGRLQRLTLTDGLMLGLAIVGAIVAARGQTMIGGGALALSAFHGWRRMSAHSRSKRKARRSARTVTAIGEDGRIRDALALLGLDNAADEEAIRAAHRRLIARNHPDAGGTQALAEKINDARAILLRHAAENKESHHHPSVSNQEPTG